MKTKRLTCTDCGCSKFRCFLYQPVKWLRIRISYYVCTHCRRRAYSIGGA